MAGIGCNTMCYIYLKNSGTRRKISGNILIFNSLYVPHRGRDKGGTGWDKGRLGLAANPCKQRGIAQETRLRCSAAPEGKLQNLYEKNNERFTSGRHAFLHSRARAGGFHGSVSEYIRSLVRRDRLARVERPRAADPVPRRANDYLAHLEENGPAAFGEEP